MTLQSLRIGWLIHELKDIGERKRGAIKTELERMKAATIDEVRGRVNEIKDPSVRALVVAFLKATPTSDDFNIWLSSPLNMKSLDVNLKATVPVILTAPHGGTSSLGSVRSRSNKQTPSFRKIGDRNTGDLVRSIASMLTTRYNVRPYFIISNVHRQYVDLNRSTSTGCEEHLAKVFHQTYHAGISTAIQLSKSLPSDIRPLLLDIHGHDRGTHAVYRGTQNGRTFVPHDCDCGHPLLRSLHNNSDVRLHPVENGAREMSGFVGGWTVQLHGLMNECDGIDAIQLEFAQSYRREKKILSSTAAAVAAAIADHVGVKQTTPSNL